MNKNAKVIAELQRIAAANGGILLPENVVEEARRKSSPLHSRFEWDDDKAAHEYRIWQARQLISVTVSFLPSKTQSPERIWVSLKEDRKGAGGYRPLVAVLSDADLRQQLLSDALEDLEFFQEKYKKLTELAEVFSAASRVQVKNKHLVRQHRARA